MKLSRDPEKMHHYTYDRDMPSYCSQCMLPSNNWRHHTIGAPSFQEPKKPSPAVPFTPRLV